MLSAATKPQTKILISLGATVVLVGVMVGLIIWPTRNRMKELHVAINEQRVELDKIYQQGKSLKIALQQYQQVKPKISILSSVYVKPGGELDIITAMENIADQQNVQQEIKTSASPDQNTKTLPLQLQTTGSFNNIVSYLTALEAMDYYLNTTTLRISLASSNLGQNLDGNSKISALLITNAFYQPWRLNCHLI